MHKACSLDYAFIVFIYSTENVFFMFYVLYLLKFIKLWHRLR